MGYSRNRDFARTMPARQIVQIPAYAGCDQRVSRKGIRW
jgi:hypothetical protein